MHTAVYSCTCIRMSDLDRFVELDSTGEYVHVNVESVISIDRSPMIASDAASLA